MNLRYSGKLTKEEYLAYVKLSNRPILKKDSSHIDMWVLFVSVGSFLSLIGLVALLQGSSTNSSSFPWHLPQLIIGIIMIGLGLKFRGALSKYWEENKESLSNVNGMISDDNVEIHTPNGKLQVDWSELDGYGEYMEMIVLYKPPVFAIPFLERFFEKQEDWHTFKKFVVDNLALTHRVNQGTPSKSKTAYILLSISMIVIFLYLYFKLKGG
jgi:hypothetical protein